MDRVGAYFMGYEPTDVEYLVRAKDAGLGECGLENIAVVGDDPEGLKH